GLVEDLDALDDVDVDHIDALIDGGSEAADRHLADEEGGRPYRMATGEQSERKGIWPFRRRSAEDQPSGPTQPAMAHEAVPKVERPIERTNEVDDIDDDRVVRVEPVADEAHPDDAPPDDAPPDDAHPGEVHAGDSAGDQAEGVDAEGDEHDQVEELFARLKADRGVPAAPGAADGNEALGVGATAVAVIDDSRESEGQAVITPDVPVAAADAGEGDADLEADELDPDAVVLHDRDAHLGPVERELGRRLKRVLADEQNEVFDLLRRDIPAGLDDVVPAADEHAQRYAAAALADLDVAALSGAASVDSEVTGSCSALASELGESLVEPMRERIARSFDECDGDLEEVTERLRSLYREWKGQRIGAAVRHYAAAAYAWGVYQAAPSDADLRWLVDRTGEACPDADDNALASGVRKGEAFPTGVLCPPAHPDCRCLVVPVGVGIGSTQPESGPRR
ncbi:MAG: hypothetical protein ACRD07_21845, partial [Acidimicrobiales bacterium]